MADHEHEPWVKDAPHNEAFGTQNVARAYHQNKPIICRKCGEQLEMSWKPKVTDGLQKATSDLKKTLAEVDHRHR